jgi:hypothetical protein
MIANLISDLLTKKEPNLTGKANLLKNGVNLSFDLEEKQIVKINSIIIKAAKNKLK